LVSENQHHEQTRYDAILILNKPRTCFFIGNKNRFVIVVPDFLGIVLSDITLVGHRAMRAFIPPTVLERLAELSQSVADKQSFGIIALNKQAIVKIFNETESRLSGLSKAEVMGRNFFTEVAPCTASRLFRGRFRQGQNDGALDEHFYYTFTYRIRPISAHVHMLYNPQQNPLLFIFIDRIIQLYEDLG